MNETTTTFQDKGLRSVSGIRWLLLAGSLVTGVSVYRLVQARWAAIPAPGQFLILVAGALAIFVLGRVTRNRLHLPAAGSALLSLFTGLVPVMAWGAVYLRLLDTTGGWIAFGVGGAALLGAAASVMRSTLGYTGLLYPAAFGVLFVAQPVLPWLGERYPSQSGTLYALAAGVLGAVLFAGSRHVDRQEGMDRPIHLLPSLFLGVLYLGGLALLDFHSNLVSLPLAVVGLVFVTTGEERYRVLLGVGFSCLVAALPLALLDSTLRCLPPVAACAAMVFLRRGWRHEQRTAHVLGVLAAFAAWCSSPALLDRAVHNPLIPGWSDIGFLALMVLFGALLARRGPEPIRRAHGVLVFLEVVAIAGLSLRDFGSAPPLLAAALALAAAGAWLMRREEPALAAQVALGALAFAMARNLGLAELPALIATLSVTGMELGALALAVRRSGIPEELRVGAVLFLRPQMRVWLALATAAGLLFAGTDTLLLSLIVVAVVFLYRTEIEGWAPRIAIPARTSLLPLLQIAALAAAGGHPVRDLPAALLSFAVLPWLGVLGLAWRGLVEILGRRHSLSAWTLAIQVVFGYGIMGAFFCVPALSSRENAMVIAAALGWAAVAVTDGLRERASWYGVAAQLWMVLAAIHGVTVGWIRLGSAAAPYLVLGAAAVEYSVGAWLERRQLAPAFAPSCRWAGLTLPLLAGGLALLRVGIWFPVLAVFAASLFYTTVALREERRVFPALASVLLLALGLLKAIAAARLGVEFYSLAPGLCLLALSWLLREELGPSWSRHVAAAGASFVYATPIVALSHEISWGWLAALLVLAVGFGAGSFGLRSRSLLTVSTAALLTDLGFFVLRIGTAAPTLLWVLGIVFGLALIALAAWLESRSEGLLQQIRLFGRQLRAWS